MNELVNRLHTNETITFTLKKGSFEDRVIPKKEHVKPLQMANERGFRTMIDGQAKYETEVEEPQFENLTCLGKFMTVSDSVLETTVSREKLQKKEGMVGVVLKDEEKYGKVAEIEKVGHADN